MCWNILGAFGKGDNRKKEGRQLRQQFRGTNIVPRQGGQFYTTKIVNNYTKLTKIIGTAGKRKDEKGMGRQHRQPFRDTNIVPRQGT